MRYTRLQIAQPSNVICTDTMHSPYFAKREVRSKFPLTLIFCERTHHTDGFGVNVSMSSCCNIKCDTRVGPAESLAAYYALGKISELVS